MSINKQSKISATRLYILVILLSLFWIILEANLFRLQIINNDLFSAAAKRQYEKKIVLPARRGAICDRKGNKLATNVIHYDLAADPKMIENKRLVAKKCAEAFSKSEKYYLNKLNQKTHFVYLERRAPAKGNYDIFKMNDNGLIIGENFRRYYPYNNYAAHLLGFTDPDDNGLSGLELQYEKELKGVEGEAVLQYDGPRRVFYNADYPLRRAEQGMDIYLTIDKNIQTVVEQELKKGVKKAKAASGMAIVMDPFSGEVLAMVNYPSFNPNRHKYYKASVKRNKTITDVFEPGSTLKIFSAAALLQEQIKKPEDIVYCENGSYKVYNHRFRDPKKHGWLSLRRVIEQSSNIGVIKLCKELPANTFFRYLKNFGFGTETGLNLIGEASGMLKNPKKWSGLSKSSMSIGQEIGVTVIQLVSAYAAVVNGGFLYRPYLVSHIKTADGEIRIVNKPEKVRQIISPEVSDILKDFMRGVVERGTGKQAKYNGIVTGGKTGTAQKFNSKTGRYYQNKYFSSFIGFAPFERPKYICAVFIDEPGNQYYGGQVAAPVFKEIINRTIHFNETPDVYRKIAQNPDSKRIKKLIDLPPIEGFLAESAISLLESKDLDYKIKGKGAIVKKVSADEDKIIIELGSDKVNMNRVPKLTGLALREAMVKLDLSKLKVSILGNGIVKKQSPSPGTVINKRTQLVLTCN